MSEAKLSSDEVPGKFADWLLAMGCPPEKVPPVEKISQMCRGTYYLVWRSLMEQVESKDTIKEKRLQVFADDVRRCKKKNLFTEQDTNVLLPPELSLWREQVEVRRKVAEAEARVAEARRGLTDVMDKVSSKMSHRAQARLRAQALHRRGWLLELLAEELRARQQGLLETRAIAGAMCCVQERTDVQPQLDRCLEAMRRQTGAPGVASSTMIGHNPSASVVQNGDVDDEHITQLAQCRGDALWSELYARRAALLASLTNKSDVVPDDGPSFQSVLSGTAALQCSLALEALKSRAGARRAQARLADAVNDLNTELTSESCELLVLRCERARTQARVAALKAVLGELAARAGAFSLPGAAPERHGARAQIDRIDKAIESKKDEVKSVVATLGATERKIQSVRECLVSIFNGFRDGPCGDGSSGRGAQLEFSTDTIASLRQFYEKHREARRNKMELSMEFDTSECSFSQLADVGTARFIDELRVYLKKFNLEKNRKLVLESGEKIWVFETLQSSLSRLHGSWQAADVTSAVACAAAPAPRCLAQLAVRVRTRAGLRAARGGGAFGAVVDINKNTDEENRIIDKVKKRLDENLRSLQKTSKTLDQGKENLCLWSDNKIKNHISAQRTVDGKPYKVYESYYLESLNF